MLEPEPPHARWDMASALLEDLSAPRHPSDGGGRAWLEDPQPATVGTPGQWSLVFEAGPLGVAEGGMVTVQVSPFWGWSSPQVEWPEALGYTVVSTGVDGVVLRAEALGDGLLGITVGGRPLAPGDTLRVEYGAGAAGARADTYAEARSRFWIAVDGDGDGVRGLIARSPGVEVRPGPAVGLVCSLPSTARPGADVEVRVAALDGSANLSTFAGEVEIHGLDVALSLVGGSGSATLSAPAPGTYRPTVRSGPLEGQCNPMLVSDAVPAVLWGDLHGHTELSDGTGTPGDYFRYARVAAGLDFASVTDHDHWGFDKLDAHPAIWAATVEAARRAHDPGRFTALPGYEWTSWVHGHRHVVYFGEAGPVLSSLDAATDTPQELMDRVRPLGDALVIPHHPAGGPVPVFLSEAPDPMVQPVIEIASVHGHSEAPDAPGVLRGPVEGAFARDHLDAGRILGLIGSGDSHDGHPGLVHLASGQGGVVAILGADNSPEGILAALRARRVYATTGPRVLLLATLDRQPMGSMVAPTAEASLVVYALAPEPVRSVEVIRSGAVVSALDAGGLDEIQVTVTLADLAPGEYAMVRLQLASGALAWSSPFFVTDGSTP